MIERVVGCLEKRGTRLPYAAHEIPLRSYRRLHSAFWSHGAGSIDLPFWWIALLQLPQGEKASETVQEDIKPRFLDFLYPSQALAFIQKKISTESTVIRRHRQILTAHQRSRAYASLPSDALLDPSDRATPSEAKDFVRQPADEELFSDKTRAEDLKAQLDNLLLIEYGEADLSELWNVYLETQSLGLTLHPRQILRFLRCLAKSRSRVNQERLLRVFNSLPISERKSIHYSYAISTALNYGKIEAAVRFHSEALLGIHVSIGTSSLLSYTVERRFWQVAVETWQAYCNHRERNVEGSDIWVEVDAIPLRELWDRTSSAIDFAAGLTELADSGAAATAREFALQLALRSFALRDTKDDSVHDPAIMYGLKRYFTFFARRGKSTIIQRHFKPDSMVGVEYPNVDKQRQLFDKATSLQPPTYELYESATRQALSFDTRLYVMQALNFYQALRANAHITPTPSLLEALLHRIRETDSQAGILLILDDYRHYHGTLPRKMYQLAVIGLARQGHHRAIEVLFEEYCLQYGKITSSLTANSILKAHERRGGVKSVVETFEALEDRYGFKPDGRSFCAVIATHARVGDVEGASTWYNSLLESGFRPTESILVSLMAMFAKRGDLEVVKQLLGQSETYGIKTSIAMIHTLVLAHVTNGQLTDAENLVNGALESAEEIPKELHTRMWNYLLNAFAMRGDLKKVTDLHRTMRAKNIPSDSVTFAALMQGLSITQLPQAAYKILTDVMPRLGVAANSLHYAICMSGYLSVKTYSRPFTLYSEMLEKGIKPTPAVHHNLIRAAAAIDEADNLKSITTSEQQTYENARRAFEQAIEDLDPTALATTDPIKFVGANRLDESFTASYFSYLILLYGKQKATDQVKILYDRYSQVKLDFNMDIDNIPPIQMLRALMAADLKIGNNDAVDRYWELSLTGAQKLAHRAGTKYSEPGWVLPARRFILNVHLRQYMRSLINRYKHNEIPKVIEYLQNCGYELDSKTWNFYIRTLIRKNEVLLAFELCEKQLIPGWLELEPPRNNLKGYLKREQPKRLEPHRRLPAYRTMQFLAHAFWRSQSSIGGEGSYPTSRQLYDVAPETMNAVSNVTRAGYLR